jgi:hypothetical protein
MTAARGGRDGGRGMEMILTKDHPSSLITKGVKELS